MKVALNNTKQTNKQAQTLHFWTFIELVYTSIISYDVNLFLADFSSSCGDGIIFNKKAGFEVKGTKAISPYFKVFKLIEATGNTAAVKYRCSFTTCNNTCDGVRNFIKSIFFY
jgi:hypothetical protein